MEIFRPGTDRTVQDFLNSLARMGPKFLKFCSSGSGSRFEPSDSCQKGSTFFGRKVTVCCGAVKISKIPSRSNFSSDPDLDFDNIEIK